MRGISSRPTRLTITKRASKLEFDQRETKIVPEKLGASLRPFALCTRALDKPCQIIFSIRSKHSPRHREKPDTFILCRNWKKKASPKSQDSPSPFPSCSNPSSPISPPHKS